MVCKNRPDNARAPAITARANGLGGPELYAMCMHGVCRAWTPSVLYYYDSLLSEKIGKIHFSSVF